MIQLVIKLNIRLALQFRWLTITKVNYYVLATVYAFSLVWDLTVLFYCLQCAWWCVVLHGDTDTPKERERESDTPEWFLPDHIRNINPIHEPRETTPKTPRESDHVCVCLWRLRQNPSLSLYTLIINVYLHLFVCKGVVKQ